VFDALSSGFQTKKLVWLSKVSDVSKIQSILDAGYKYIEFQANPILQIESGNTTFSLKT